MALVAALPPDHQQSVYRSESAGPPPQPRATVHAPQPQDPATDDPEAHEDDDAESWNSVLLLGTVQECAANAHLLEHHKFNPIRISGRQAFEEAGDAGVCGVVIYGSWWNQFDRPGETVEFIRRRITRSNLLYAKIQCTNLGDAEQPVGVLIQDFDDDVKARINCSLDAELSTFDLRGLEAVATALRAGQRVQVGVEGIGALDRQLLAVAVAAFGRAKHLPRAQGLEELSIRPMHEGRSGAEVLAVRSEAYRLILVAKLDDLPALEAELDRARLTMPSRWLTAGELCLYSIGGRGVLLQRLLGELDSPEDGAPSLRERLRQCAAWENGRTGIPEPDAGELRRGIDRLVEKVIELNREAHDEPPSRGWMDAETLGRLAGLHVRWQVGEADGKFDPADHLDRAKQILDAHQGRRVVHGDLHTGNTLMPDAQTPDLIDFALAGSGHPCFDLVRVSSAIAYEFLRQVDEEAEFRSFFSRLHVDGASESELESEFPELLIGVGPRMALHALVACRSSAVEATEGQANEARLQYLAMVYLVAAQSLTVGDFQEGVVRSALAAVGPVLAN